MIGHEIAGDRKSELDRVGQTGKRWYFQAQRIPEKTRAMAQWSEALLTAYKKAGGLYRPERPEPRITEKLSIYGFGNGGLHLA